MLLQMLPFTLFIGRIIQRGRTVVVAASPSTLASSTRHRGYAFVTPMQHNSPSSGYGRAHTPINTAISNSRLFFSNSSGNVRHRGDVAMAASASDDEHENDIMSSYSPSRSRRNKNNVNRGDSRLASFYDEMFADDKDNDNDNDNDNIANNSGGSGIDRGGTQNNANMNNYSDDSYRDYSQQQQQIMQQQVNQKFTNEFTFDDDFPAHLPEDMEIIENYNQGHVQQKAKGQSFPKPSPPPPSAAAVAASASAPKSATDFKAMPIDPVLDRQASRSTQNNANMKTQFKSPTSVLKSPKAATQTFSASASASAASVPVSTSQPRKRQMQKQRQRSQEHFHKNIEQKLGRPMPPPVREYDYSHCDTEFGTGQMRADSFEIPEFHDGMLEEMEAEAGISTGKKMEEPKLHHQGMREKSSADATIDGSMANTGDEFVEGNGSVSAESTEQSLSSNMVSVPLPESTSIPIPTSSTSDIDRMESDSSTKKSMNETPQSEPQLNKQESKDVDIQPPNNWKPQMQPPPRPTSVSITRESISIYGNGHGGAITSQSTILASQIERVTTEIYKLNQDEPFNINSHKQVSSALFGVDNESTNKAALEALCGNLSRTDGKSHLAGLILKYRKYKRQLSRLEKQTENIREGTHVSNVGSMRNGKANSSIGSGSGPISVQPSSIVAPLESNGNGNAQEREPLVLIDASAYIFRAYYSMPPMHRPDDGEPTGATLGFCNMLNKLVLSPMLKGEQPRVVLVFDSKHGTNFRKKMYPEYKSNRKPCPLDLVPQFDFVRDAADAYGILQIEAPGYEADDVIATLSHKAVKEGCHVNILTGDKDLMQLVTKDDGGACIEMIDPMKMVRYCHDTVTEKWGVEPNKVGEILGLAGDSADNIPGVPGIGPKIAATLIQEFGSIDNLLENVDDVKQKSRREKLKEHADMARLSRELVELERNVPGGSLVSSAPFERVDDIRMEKLNEDRLIAFYEKMGFRDLTKRVQSRLPNQNQKANGFKTSTRFGKAPAPEDYKNVPF